jgi:hypothetical protein
MRRLREGLAVLALLVLVPAAAFAQASITGTVKDASGVVLPGVTVEASSPALIEKTRSAVTDGSGQYRIVDLRAGVYAVTFTLTGFSSVKRDGIELTGSFTAAVNADMKVGAIEETITVTGESPIVETSNASVGEVLNSQTLQSLPTVGRNAFLMAVTVPTVVSSGDTHWNRMQDQTGASALSMGGGGVRANNYLLDGFPVTDLGNRSSTNPSVEALEDVKVQIHTYDAEMGRTGGGVFNATAKSGSNTFRGTAFTQLRPGKLIGPNFFAKIQGQEDRAQFWRDFGAGFGGPIKKDKTFFWWAAEGYRDGLSQNGNVRFPTPAERTGDF